MGNFDSQFKQSLVRLTREDLSELERAHSSPDFTANVWGVIGENREVRDFLVRTVNTLLSENDESAGVAKATLYRFGAIMVDMADMAVAKDRAERIGREAFGDDADAFEVRVANFAAANPPGSPTEYRSEEGEAAA